jgi:gas vesicle protein
MNAYEGYNSGSNGTVLAFVCGALVGASAALLFAQMRGEEMRDSIGDAARQSKDRLRHYGEAGREWAADRVQKATEVSRSALHRATDVVDTAVDRAQSAINQGAARAHEATERARSAVGRGLEQAKSTAQDVSEQAGDTIKSTREQWS